MSTLNKPLLSFRNYLERICEGTNTIEYLDQLARAHRILIFSGVIRDYFLGMEEKKPRDIDVVIMDVVTLDDVRGFIKTLPYKKNHYGGYKANVGSITIDIWPISQTWGIREKKLSPTPENLIQTAFFNFSSVAYKYNEEEFIFSDEFFRFMDSHKLDVVMEDNPLTELCIANTVYYSKKYNLPIAERLLEWIDSHYDSSLDYEIIQLEHFGEIMHSNDEIEKYINLILNRMYYV